MSASPARRCNPLPASPVPYNVPVHDPDAHGPPAWMFILLALIAVAMMWAVYAFFRTGPG